MLICSGTWRPWAPPLMAPNSGEVATTFSSRRLFSSNNREKLLPPVRKAQRLFVYRLSVSTKQVSLVQDSRAHPFSAFTWKMWWKCVIKLMSDSNTSCAAARNYLEVLRFSDQNLIWELRNLSVSFSLPKHSRALNGLHPQHRLYSHGLSPQGQVQQSSEHPRHMLQVALHQYWQRGLISLWHYHP